jgi:hypothetical protein
MGIVVGAYPVKALNYDLRWAYSIIHDLIPPAHFHGGDFQAKLGASGARKTIWTNASGKRMRGFLRKKFLIPHRTRKAHGQSLALRQNS